MKNKNIFIAISLFVLALDLGFTLDFNKTFSSLIGTVTITKESTINFDLQSPQMKFTKEFTTQDINGLTYIYFDEGKWLCLFSDEIIVLYNSEGWPFFSGINGSSKLRNNFGSGLNNRVSSFLTEGNVEYRVENLNKLTTFSPWVEGVSGNGISEWIEVNYYKDSSLGNLSGLIFYNGFVSYEKPYLYSKNNRVRSFEVYDSENNYMMDIVLDDTPNPQFKKLMYPSNTVTLKIKSIYPGSEWDDTCLNVISCVPESMVYFFMEEEIAK